MRNGEVDHVGNCGCFRIGVAVWADTITNSGGAVLHKVSHLAGLHMGLSPPETKFPSPKRAIS